MVKKILLAVLALALVAIAYAAIGLTWANVAIRGERVPLPKADAIVQPAGIGEGPIRVSMINTASQAMPRSVLLAADHDPRPNEPYVLSHPSFVLEWADGRILLIDLGMDPEEARAFGRFAERFGGAAAIQPLGSVAERLGEARTRVQGAVFTHLHTDHTQGIVDLCRALKRPLPVFMTAAQSERPNFTTRPGLKLLHEAGCVRQERPGPGPLGLVPGFPGVSLIAAGGHTPCSQMVVAHVQGAEGARTVIFAGDIVNNIDGITYDLPKPWLYRLLVPEDDERLGELRRLLRDLRDRSGLTVLVSHDQRQLEQSDVPTWQLQRSTGDEG